jgi:hypothetical protein
MLSKIEEKMKKMAKKINNFSRELESTKNERDLLKLKKKNGI